jgi:hypothetical protein
VRTNYNYLSPQTSKPQGIAKGLFIIKVIKKKELEVKDADFYR